jgi:hypothetical protein
MMLWLVTAALAYETDQLTDRHIPLADSLVVSNEVVNARLSAAVDAANARTRCKASDRRTARVLAREIYARTGQPASIPSRGFLRSPGFTVYSVWMETDDAVERRSFPDPRGDIFSELGFLESAVLATAGTASTFQLAGVTLGSDKPDHFWDLGFAYFERSRWGAQPERGIAHGVATEYGIYGLATSNTFSWADLAANYAGYLWYEQLLSDTSELQRGEDGCVVQVADFDWAQWVTWEWDEVLNPPQFTPVVERGVQRHLFANRESYCASYDAWAGASHAVYLHEALSGAPLYAQGAPGNRRDPYRLDVLCGAHVAAERG